MHAVSKIEFAALAKAVVEYWWETKQETQENSEGQNLDLARSVYYRLKYKLITDKARKSSASPYFYENAVRVITSSLSAFFMCYYKDRPQPKTKEEVHKALENFYLTDSVSKFYENNIKEHVEFFKEIHELFFVHLQTQVFDSLLEKQTESFTKFPYYNLDDEDKEFLDEDIKKLSKKVQVKTCTSYKESENFVYTHLAIVVDNFLKSLSYNYGSVLQFYPDLTKDFGGTN